MGRFAGIVAIGLAAAAITAPAAQAATDYFVSKAAGSNDANPCTAGQPCATIQHVAASVAASGDTINVGPGLYLEAVSAATKDLSFVGAGAGAPDSFNATTDTMVRPTSNDVAIRMQGGGSVANMKLEGGANGASQPGLRLSALGAGGSLSYAVTDVIASGGLFNTVRASAITVDDGGTGRTMRVGVRRTRANVQGSPGVKATGANVAVLLDDSSIVPLAGGKQVGFDIGGGASGTLSRSRVGDNFAMSAAMSIHDDGSIGGVNRSQLRVQGQALRVSTSTGTARATVLNSELVNINPDTVFGTAAVRVENNSNAAGSQTLFTARGSTLVGRGSLNLGAVLGLGVVGPTVAGSSAEATLQNTAVRGIATDATTNHADIGAADLATVTAENSSFTDLLTSGSPTVPGPGSGTNVAGDPGFVDPSADNYALVAGSPLVDRGAPGFLLGATELDLDGNPRSLDGDGDCVAAPDIGAHERPAATCSPPAQGGGGGGGGGGERSGGGASGQPTTTGGDATSADLLAATISGFGVERRRFAVGRAATAVAAAKRTPKGTAFRYSLSEAATVRIAIERKAPGLRSGTRCGKPTAKLRRKRAKRCTRYIAVGALTRGASAGANRTPFSGRIGRRALKPGSYKATIGATDVAGNVSTPAPTSFVVARR